MEIKGGNYHAKDWQDEARQIIEKNVRHSIQSTQNILRISNLNGLILQ